MKKEKVFDILSIISAVFVLVMGFLIYAKIDENGNMVNKLFNTNITFKNLNKGIEAFFNSLFHINIGEENQTVDGEITYIEISNHSYKTDSHEIKALEDGTIIYKTIDDGNYVLSVDYGNYQAVYFSLNDTKVSPQDHFLKGEIIAEYEEKFQAYFYQGGKEISYQKIISAS